MWEKKCCCMRFNFNGQFVNESRQQLMIIAVKQLNIKLQTYKKEHILIKLPTPWQYTWKNGPVMGWGGLS